MTLETKEFVLECDTVALGNEHLQKELNDVREQLETIRLEHEKLTKEYERLQSTNDILRISIAEEANEDERSDDEDDDDPKTTSGIVYYIIDRELHTRAKIGRTGQTNIKKLKTRYSIFGYPFIFCCHCDDIRRVEKELKMRLLEADCMNLTRGKESVIHSDESLRIFLDVVQEYHLV
jgi:chromosome segregation ATPase